MNMRILIIGFCLVLFIGVLIGFMGYSEWHLNRNKHNRPPGKKLNHVKGDFYKDEDGLIWELQPQSKNIFHQPDEPVKIIENPYPNIDHIKKMDPKQPNLKFLSALENGGSYEAIIQPDGTLLETGKKRGTYNYGHPSGIWGSIKHVVLDVIPHFVNSNYL